jgi:hypothetical protein
MNAQWFNATPLLPHPDVQYLSVHLGWGLVLATLLLWAARRWTGMNRTGHAVLVALGLGSCFLPGSLSPAFWLGLAFQAPSLCTVLICATMLHAQLRSGSTLVAATVALLMPVLIFSVGLGWLLLLDTLALLPFQLYALGFHLLTSGLLLLLGLLPCIVHGAAACRNGWVRVLPAAVVLFVLFRWPSGNVWDAVLDPWLWLCLNGYVIYNIWKRKSTD